MKEIKPIETIYKGYRFRSRLEARWAVFFDALGVDWEYEPEGFELPSGRRYLPDFRVKCWGTRGGYSARTAFWLWIEVKGDMSEDDYSRIIEFSGVKNEGPYGILSHPILIVGAIPESAEELCLTSSDRFYPMFNYELIDGDYFGAYPTSTSSGDFYLMGDDCNYMDEEGLERLDRALTAARSARFEWGENGESA